MHPDHERGDPGNQNFGYIHTSQPTRSRSREHIQLLGYADPLVLQVNYPSGNPIWNLDHIQCLLQQPGPEDEVHIPRLSHGTYVPGTNRVIVNWEGYKGKIKIGMYAMRIATFTHWVGTTRRSPRMVL